MCASCARASPSTSRTTATCAVKRWARWCAKTWKCSGITSATGSVPSAPTSNRHHPPRQERPLALPEKPALHRGGAGVCRRLGTVALVAAPSLVNPALVKLDQVDHADDLVRQVGAAYVRQRFLEKFPAARRHALLHIIAVPLGGADIRREERLQLRVDLDVRGGLKYDFSTAFGSTPRCTHRKRSMPRL